MVVVMMMVKAMVIMVVMVKAMIFQLWDDWDPFEPRSMAEDRQEPMDQLHGRNQEECMSPYIWLIVMAAIVINFDLIK